MAETIVAHVPVRTTPRVLAVETLPECIGPGVYHAAPVFFEEGDSSENSETVARASMMWWYRYGVSGWTVSECDRAPRRASRHVWTGKAPESVSQAAEARET